LFGTPAFQCADLDVVESRHEVCGDLSRFLFRYGIGGILFTLLRKRIQVCRRPCRATTRNSSTGIAGTASKRVIRNVARWGIGPFVLPDWWLDVPNFLHEITKGDRRVLESMGKIVVLCKRTCPR